MKAIRVHKPGGPEALVLDEIPVPEPKSGEARVKMEAIGINFIDIALASIRWRRPLRSAWKARV
jgi:NADPH2:quinone reductase